jgi:hypothetical protein
MLMQAFSPWRSRYRGVPVDVRVVHGAPAGHLLEAAMGARLVVVGTHARAPARAWSSARRAVRSRGAARARS